MERTLKQYANMRMSALRTERSSWLDHYRELSDFIQPRRGRFLASDKNKGGKKNDKIIDGTATRSVNILRAGMMSGLTNPARPWFKLGVPDMKKMESAAVKQWLEIVEERMNAVFNKSNLYNSLPTVYEELGIFGTAPMMIEEDFNDVIFTSAFTAGEYFIALNDKMQVNAFGRECEFTVGQIVQWFGRDKCSLQVKALYDRQAYDEKIKIFHLIEPNDGRYPMGLQQDREFRGMYWEENSNDDSFLEIKGFHEFPIVCPRWDVTSGDTYGRSQGMEVLGDVKQLQMMHKRKLEGLDKWVKPAMKAPTSLRNQKASILPADITYIDEISDKGGFKPIYEVRPEIGAITEEIRDVRQRIEQGFYADLFLMMAMSDRRQITAREIEERHEEKLLMLGPVLQRLNDEMLDPLIERTFNIMVRNSQSAWEQGLPAIIPPPPPELEGEKLNIEYISTLSQAQKAVATGSLDRLLANVANMAAVSPGVLDKVNWDEAVDKYASMLGTPQSVVFSDEQVAKIREDRAKEQAAAQQKMDVAQQAETAKTLGQAKTGQNTTALGDILEQLGA